MVLAFERDAMMGQASWRWHLEWACFGLHVHMHAAQQLIENFFQNIIFVFTELLL